MKLTYQLSLTAWFRVATGQETVLKGEKGILQGQGKMNKFHPESGEEKPGIIEIIYLGTAPTFVWAHTFCPLRKAWFKRASWS